MHQNYFLTSKSTLNARGADPTMRKFFPPPNMNYYKGSVQTEPDQDLREEKHDFRQQVKYTRTCLDLFNLYKEVPGCYRRR